ncbi:hypothetical protein AADZ91_01085 [Colwelliaceae bacterium 6441]
MTDIRSNRWRMCKKLVIFQVKLAFDAIRDLFLSPISFGCALIDIINNNSDEQSYFKKLMIFGGKTDSWLNLFSQHEQTLKKAQHQLTKTEIEAEHASSTYQGDFSQNNADQLFDKIEDLLREQHAKGGLTAAAKTKIDAVLQKISKDNQTNPPANNASQTNDQ